MLIGDVMSTSITVVLPDTPYKELWRAIFRRRVNALPVVDKRKKLIGIITKEDLLKTLYADYEELIDDFSSVADFEKMEEKVRELSGFTAKDVMSRRVVYTRENTPIMRALSRMIVRRLNQLPVLSKGDDYVVGMVTKGDVFYALVRRQLTHSDKTAKKKK